MTSCAKPPGHASWMWHIPARFVLERVLMTTARVRRRAPPRTGTIRTPSTPSRRGRSSLLVLGVLVLAAVGVLLLRMRRRSRAT